MKYIYTLILTLFIVSSAGAAGTAVFNDIHGKPYEGYFTSPSPEALLFYLCMAGTA